MTAISICKNYSSAGVLKTFCGLRSQAKYCYPTNRILPQIHLFINKLLQNILPRHLNNLSKTFVNAAYIHFNFHIYLSILIFIFTNDKCSKIHLIPAKQVWIILLRVSNCEKTEFSYFMCIETRRDKLQQFKYLTDINFGE